MPRSRMERVSCTSTNISDMRCCSAWKRPIGWPNCWRVFRYSLVMASTASMQPRPSATCASAARSSASSSSIGPEPGADRRASAGTNTPVSATSAARVPSISG